MPKKHTFNFKQLTGASSSKQAAPNNGDDSTNHSVKERLNELRKLEGKEAAAKKRALAESVNQRSVPPDVREILGLSESAPPRPKVAARVRDRMRTPGPAPPRSWVAGSPSGAWTPVLGLRGARQLKRNADAVDRSRPLRLFRFDHLTGLSSDDVEAPTPSLMHLAFKAIAESWHMIDEADYPALADVPVRLRIRLLSYIGFYGAPIDPRGLQAILQGNESIKKIDLAGLIGYQRLSVRKLAHLIEEHRPTSLQGLENAVQDSWDAEVDPDTMMHQTPSISPFSNMTHICLSHPGPGASWKDLLALVKVTPQVTHLSLAYWPRPTLTPNLATTTVSCRTGDVSAGGSHYYSSLDQDMTEPAALLRQLSSNLLCLQWLDLEGCYAWMHALTRLAATNPSENNHAGDSSTQDDGWGGHTPSQLSIFSSNWKNLSFLRCAQGRLPSLIGISNLSERHTTAIDRLIIDGIIKHLKQIGGEASIIDRPSQDVLDVEKKKARLWLEAEYASTYASIQVNSCRRDDGCRPVAMDFGWVKRHV